MACQPASTVPGSLADCRVVPHPMGETCVPARPARIVALDHTSVGDLLSLGVRPVGVPNNLLQQISDRVPEAQRLGQSEQINLEAVAALQPDLIIVSVWDAETIYDKLTVIAPTVVFDMQTTADWQRPFRFHGEVLGMEAEAAAVLAEYQQRIEDLKARLGEERQQIQVSLVRVLAQSGQIGLYLKNCFGGSILSDLGLARPPSQNEGAPDQPPFVKLISREALPQADGDIIFMSTFGATPEIAAAAAAELEELRSDPLWQTLQAVQQNRVYRVGHYWGAGNSPLAADWILDDVEQYILNPSGSEPKNSG
ncbi:iron-siderophore ABC transporter substrate-binding protein [Romeria aff. gracilis LEGE 07310]|uniref:Iron-siderophore ABC transporter substrate-binding protein n=2 Tax=Vasconcelosia TaxID=3366328 RepID=A0A8J7A4S5_9CYAN|nr:iron-siderophore ABC transporter substrate-binding protein [Romeria aff. gracilis LEGE 07310]